MNRDEGYVFGRYEVARMADRIFRQMLDSGEMPTVDNARLSVRLARTLIAEVEQTQPPRE